MKALATAWIIGILLIFDETRTYGQLLAGLVIVCFGIYEIIQLNEKEKS